MEKKTAKTPAAKKPAPAKQQAKPAELKKSKEASAKAAVEKAVVTVAEVKKEKKVAAAVTKEVAAANRLTKARSSLAAGIEAAISGGEKPQQPLRAPLVPDVSAKPVVKKNFDAISNTAQVQERPVMKPTPKPAAAPLKSNNGKVDFDDLMKNANAAVAQAMNMNDVIKYKK